MREEGNIKSKEQRMNRMIYKVVFVLYTLFSPILLLAACNNDIKANNTTEFQNGQSQVLNVEINGAVGKLSAVIGLPALKQGETCPMVILMHGFMSEKQDRVISTIGDKLLAKGIAYIRFDFNGHGESEGEFQNMTVLNEIEDARKVYEYARSLAYVSDIFLLGHSQGGVVAGMTAGELGTGKIAGLVLMAPAAVLKDNSLEGNIMGNAFAPVNTPEYVLIFGHRLGRDYIKTAQTLPIYETAAQYTGPVCVIHGKADEIVPYSYGERFKSEYKDCELHLLENEDHVFSHRLEEAADIAVEFLSRSKK